MINKNIFVACDVSSQKEIIDLLNLIHSDISGIKIGLQYITQRSPEEIKELLKFKKPIFYDGKFFDIKNTLIESINALKELKINYATVHLLNGLDALKAANEAAKKINVKLLGVSVLTSFENKDLNSLGFKDISKSSVPINPFPLVLINPSLNESCELNSSTFNFPERSVNEFSDANISNAIFIF